MPTQIQLRRGTTAEHSSFTGAAGEVTVDTTKKTLVVHDGSTAGGIPMAKENNATLTGSVTLPGTSVFNSTGLGIGTSSPATYSVAPNLVVASSGGGGMTVRTNSTYGGVYFADGVTGDEQYRGYVQYNHNQGGLTDALVFGTAGTGKMTLDASGNLGLGVTPSAWSTLKGFDISSGGALFGYTAQVGLANNAYFDGSSWRYKNTDSAMFFRANALGFEWHTAPSGTAGNAITFTQAMTLDASGNLGIGASSPSYKLQTVGQAYFGTVGGTIQLRFGNDSAANYWGIGRDNVSTGDLVIQSQTTERARITSSGDLLVGKNASNAATYGFEARASGVPLVATNTSSNACYFNRQTDDGAVVNFARGGSTVGSVSVTTTATAYNTSSDYRLKNNPQPLTGSGAFIDALQPKTWHWKDDGSKGVGFIAHEVQEISPGSVVGTKDAVDAEGKPVMQAMEYGSAEFIANIIAELQSLRARVAQLEQGA